MFNYPIGGQNAGRSIVYQFTGLDRRDRIADGACREMVNLSSDAYPCMAPRAGRTQLTEYPAATAALFKNGKLFVIDGTAAKYGGETVGAVTAGRKQMAVMNDWIFLWPDKAAFNAATGEFRAMETHVGALAVTFTNSTITRKDGADWPFQVGDGVTISGCGQEYNNRTSVVQAVEGSTLTFYDNVFQYGELDSDENQSTHEWDEAAVRFDITVPALEYVCEKDNRLWGVYGNHICCCKLGDGFNWNVFNGLSTDAFDVQVGSDGPFTGIAGYSNYILAFKEHCVHKLYGTKPTNYTANISYVEGVQEGCADTLVIYNNALFYLSRSGVMAYGGGTPESIGGPLNRDYVRAVAGRHMDKYVLCGTTEEGESEIVVYDTEHGIWVREDDAEVVCFAADRGVLHFVDADGSLWRCGTDDPVAWSATFGPFEEVGSEKKITNRIDVVLKGEPGAVVEVAVQQEGGPWRTIRRGSARRPDGTLVIPQIPMRGHEFRLRVSGTGRAVLHSLVRHSREGSAR